MRELSRGMGIAEAGSTSGNKPVVSVLVLSYNEAPWLHQCIESILAQETDFPFEILIHDDASTDDSLEVLERILLVHSLTCKADQVRIRVVTEAENQYSRGVNLVQQVLLPMAEGEYVAFLEADDAWCSPKKLKRQYEYMRRHPSCALLTHATRVVWAGGAWHGNARGTAEYVDAWEAGERADGVSRDAEIRRAERTAGQAADTLSKKDPRTGAAGDVHAKEMNIAAGTGAWQVAVHTAREAKACIRRQRQKGQFSCWKEEHVLTQEEIFLDWAVHTSSYFIRRQGAALPQWAWECWCGDYVVLTWLSLQGEVVFLPEQMSIYRTGRPDAVTALGGGRGVDRPGGVLERFGSPQPEDHGFNSGFGRLQTEESSSNHSFGNLWSENLSSSHRFGYFRSGQFSSSHDGVDSRFTRREARRMAYLLRLDQESGYRRHDVVMERVRREGEPSLLAQNGG